jgi:hypothetical protein
MLWGFFVYLLKNNSYEIFRKGGSLVHVGKNYMTYEHKRKKLQKVFKSKN